MSYTNKRKLITQNISVNGGVALINTIIFPTGTISTLTFPCKFPKKKGHEITFLNTMREDLMLNSFDDNIPIILIFCNCFNSRLGFNCDNFHFCRQQDKDLQWLAAFQKGPKKCRKSDRVGWYSSMPNLKNSHVWYHLPKLNIMIVIPEEHFMSWWFLSKGLQIADLNLPGLKPALGASSVPELSFGWLQGL